MSIDLAIAGLDLVDPAPTLRGSRIEAVHLEQVVAGGRRILDDISLTIEPGQLVAIAGGSGAGKSTLLDALAGLRPPSSGTVRFAHVGDEQLSDTVRTPLGYVPQDDIIHRDLPLRATLRYAAQLRLPAATTRAEIDALVDETLETLGLADRADVRVGKLSGGQRKRASIGVELLTRPRALFLDEPTSGLDPATARDLVRTLRRLADEGTTVVLTTHNTDDLRLCDRVVFLARGGRLVYDGPLDDATLYFEVDDVAEIYQFLARSDLRQEGGRRRRSADATPPPAKAGTERGAAAVSATSSASPGALRQWAILTARNVASFRHNRLTMAITIGSPVAVIAMFAILFERGTFDAGAADPNAGVMVAFWTAFAAFFFGLTFGLLQVVTELPILRRERFVGLNLGSYLIAKLTVLVPALLGVIVLMVAVLTALQRLPTMGAGATVTLVVSLLLLAVAATALGLLASAAVADPAQATLALPMLCFPAVLFSGAVVPVETMTTSGRVISVVTPNRWGFEAVGRELVEHLPSTGRHEHLARYGDALSGSAVGHWLSLAAFATLFLATAVGVLRRRTAAAPAPATRP
jgi:ABC-type multidrug transport system ATPase subunit/ABC-type multidrug transport system permease subunit